MDTTELLRIKDLHVHYLTDLETVKAVNGIDLSIGAGESLGLVGETGAGKTTTCRAIMQLIPDPPGLIVQGEVLFKGENLVHNTEKRNQEIRGAGISMIFQDPMTALNPIMTIGAQLTEVVKAHDPGIKGGAARRKVIDMLEIVGVKADRINDYPHQFSGGMKQRVVITMALLCRPELLIADEPTTALDVTIQAQVLELIRKLRREFNMALLLVTHDLGIVAELCDRAAIMYSGEIVETGTVREIFLDTKHPYTRGLFESIPKLDGDTERLVPIEGTVPNPADLPTGCCFHPRCKHRRPECETQKPGVKGDGHTYKCYL
ncbi:dipeptide/oligopeptide/nickel ABC transporter ATP-binding protein [Spirochaetia bacterium]|nr:dipeptide/oligopeptide/nickel ABC transporter ATP-binding protein [Spirochaetia bacterium]